MDKHMLIGIQETLEEVIQLLHLFRGTFKIAI